MLLHDNVFTTYENEATDVTQRLDEIVAGPSDDSDLRVKRVRVG